jgi:hypothetical protein
LLRYKNVLKGQWEELKPVPLARAFLFIDNQFGGPISGNCSRLTKVLNSRQSCGDDCSPWGFLFYYRR